MSAVVPHCFESCCFSVVREVPVFSVVLVLPVVSVFYVLPVVSVSQTSCIF